MLQIYRIADDPSRAPRNKTSSCRDPRGYTKLGAVNTKNMVLTKTRDAGSRLRDIIQRNRSSEALGVYAVCSAHPQVIVAASREAGDNRSVLHVGNRLPVR